MKNQAELVKQLIAEARPAGECLLSDRPRRGKGYVQFRSGKILGYAHRLVAAQSAGLSVLSLTRSDVVRHSCDVRNCINPDHLTIGTMHENHQDMRQKGRGTAGETHPNTDMSFQVVERIRSLYATGGYTQRRLASMFRCTQGHISNLCRGTRRPNG